MTKPDPGFVAVSVCSSIHPLKTEPNDPSPRIWSDLNGFTAALPTQFKVKLSFTQKGEIGAPLHELVRTNFGVSEGGEIESLPESSGVISNVLTLKTLQSLVIVRLLHEFVDGERLLQRFAAVGVFITGEPGRPGDEESQSSEGEKESVVLVVGGRREGQRVGDNSPA
ncbi:GntR family transcriptional regulator [Striga asiatica]|uniref:GntR family transcriptional regulator n=1 Tax=Striga asiatica TaxID=4170 RepID=A0A5A7PHY0_STRAF|nr:GntR family transcriptional regulator [Striga asiatica]